MRRTAKIHRAALYQHWETERPSPRCGQLGDVTLSWSDVGVTCAKCIDAATAWPATFRPTLGAGHARNL